MEGNVHFVPFVNHRPGTYYNSDYYHYDQYTGKELLATGTYAGKFKDAAIEDKIARMTMTSMWGLY